MLTLASEQGTRRTVGLFFFRVLIISIPVVIAMPMPILSILTGNITSSIMLACE